MIKATNIRKGMILKYEKALYEVRKTDHVTPGKGNALMQVDVRQLDSGKSMRIRFRSVDVVEQIYFEAKKHQYMYSDNSIYYFIDLEDYNTIGISEDVIGDYRNFLVEDMAVGIAFHDEKPIHIELPKGVSFRVTLAEPWLKGDTVSGGTKPVEIETGITIKVPVFINEGDLIKIDTETGEYLERTK